MGRGISRAVSYFFFFLSFYPYYNDLYEQKDFLSMTETN